MELTMRLAGQVGMTIAVAGAVLVAACSSRRSRPEPTVDDGRTEAGPVLDAATPDATRAAPAATDAEPAAAPRPWHTATDSLAADLTRDAGGAPLLLVETRQGLEARTASGKRARVLVAGPLSRSQYDARIGVAWYVRGDTLEALDLTRPAAAPVVVVADMPDLGFEAGPGVDAESPSCDACVGVAVHPAPRVAVNAEPTLSGHQFATAEAARNFERDHGVALGARPRLTDDGTRFLASLAARSVVASATWLELGERIWPSPPSARSRPRCTRSCGRGFDLTALGWSLLVVDRVCDCLVDACWPLCVLHDATTDRYAQPSRPERWGRDARAERSCQLQLDATGAAYVLEHEHQVCTAAGCRSAGGRVLGWLVPGMSTVNVDEDTSSCPEGP